MRLQRLAGNRAVAMAIAGAPTPARSSRPTAAALKALSSDPVVAAGDRPAVAASGLSSPSFYLDAARGDASTAADPIAVHDRPESHRAAARLGVHAYTFRGQIALGAGLDEPGGPGRDATLAHELIHARQMRSGGPVASTVDVESAALEGRNGVCADPETPHGLWWLIPVAIGAYILLRPNIVNAPSPEDVRANRLQSSVSELQVAGEASVLHVRTLVLCTSQHRRGRR